MSAAPAICPGCSLLVRPIYVAQLRAFDNRGSPTRSKEAELLPVQWNLRPVSATAPETNGVAALVPPSVRGAAVAPRLVTASPAAPSLLRPMEAPRMAVRRGAAACVTADLTSAALAPGNSDHYLVACPGVQQGWHDRADRRAGQAQPPRSPRREHPRGPGQTAGGMRRCERHGVRAWHRRTAVKALSGETAWLRRR